jgi:hypothetical protein
MKDAFIDGETLEAKLQVKCSYIERTLGLPQRSLKDKKFLELPETQALLRIIYVMPWVLEVAEHNFDPEKSGLLLQREAINIRLRE